MSDDYRDQLPPGNDDQEHEAIGGDQDQQVFAPGEPLPNEQRAQLTDDDRAAIAQHAETAIETVAKIGSELLPVALRQDYQDRMTNSDLIRGAVLMTGMPHALHELMPSSGPQGVGALPPKVQRIHPVVRLLAGVAVLGIVSAFQIKAVQANGQAAANHPGTSPGGAGGSVGVPNGSSLLGRFLGGSQGGGHRD